MNKRTMLKILNALSTIEGVTKKDNPIFYIVAYGEDVRYTVRADNNYASEGCFRFGKLFMARNKLDNNSKNIPSYFEMELRY